jgi:N-acetylglucosamine kinase-like BadF-type ATPase
MPCRVDQTLLKPLFVPINGSMSSCPEEFVIWWKLPQKRVRTIAFLAPDITESIIKGQQPSISLLENSSEGFIYRHTWGNNTS